jgi:hypothetical protein
MACIWQSGGSEADFAFHLLLCSRENEEGQWVCRNAAVPGADCDGSQGFVRIYGDGGELITMTTNSERRLHFMVYDERQRLICSRRDHCEGDRPFYFEDARSGLKVYVFSCR